MFRPNASVRVIGGRFFGELADKVGVIDKIMDSGAMVCSFPTKSGEHTAFLLSEQSCRLAYQNDREPQKEKVEDRSSEDNMLADLAEFGASLYQ